MKTSMKTIVIAIVLYGMFAGFAAAETNDNGNIILDLEDEENVTN